MSVFGVILIRIFLHLDWIRRNTYSELFWSERGKRQTRIIPHTNIFHAVNGDVNAIANGNDDAHVPLPRFSNGCINHQCIICATWKLNKIFWWWLIDLSSLIVWFNAIHWQINPYIRFINMITKWIIWNHRAPQAFEPSF